MTFSSVPDYLIGSDKACGFIDDRTVVVSKGMPEELKVEKLKAIPQWVLLSRMKETMWSKEGVDASPAF